MLGRLLVTLACAQVAFAQNYYITNPVEGTVFNAGKTETIRWTGVQEPKLPDAKSVRIELVDGDANNARFVMNIASDIAPGATSYDWNVPVNVPVKTDYFLRMSATNEGGKVEYNFSARFSVLGGTGDWVAPVDPSGGVATKAPWSSGAATGASAILSGAAAMVAASAAASLLML